MTIKLTLSALALVGATTLITAEVVSQSYEGQVADAQAAAAAEMEKWMALGQPGEEHKEMAEHVGRWEQVQKHWMAPGIEPSSGTAISEIKSIFDGRFLVEKIKGTFVMDGQEVPTEGLGVFGYDRVKEKQFFVWFDSMSTSCMYGEGVKNADGDIVYMSEMTEPGGGTMTIKSISHMTDSSAHEFTMHREMPDGSWFQMMESTATRIP
jgi:hypothetical protein